MMRNFNELQPWEQQAVIWLSAAAMCLLGYIGYVGIAALCYMLEARP
jgi:hypothetical protein